MKKKNIFSVVFLSWFLVSVLGTVTSSTLDTHLKFARLHEAKLRNLEEKRLSAIKYINSEKCFRETHTGEEIYNSIEYFSSLYNLSPDVVISMAKVESDFYTKAVSNMDCRGILQVSKFALADFNSKSGHKYTYTFDEMYELDKNLDVACWYINRLNVVYEKSGRDLMLAYNCGPSSNKITSYPEKVQLAYSNLLNF